MLVTIYTVEFGPSTMGCIKELYSFVRGWAFYKSLTLIELASRNFSWYIK
jgi:hypothetical protein